MTKHDLIEQREAMQDDVITILDGIEQDYIDSICACIVERFDILIEQMEEEGEVIV